MGCAAVQLIKKEDDDSFSVYKYNGALAIDRHLENNVIDDTIENIQDMKQIFKNSSVKNNKNAAISDCIYKSFVPTAISLPFF